MKEIKAGVKDTVKHLPDGHRGSIASLTEKPPYKQMAGASGSGQEQPKQSKQTEF